MIDNIIGKNDNNENFISDIRCLHYNKVISMPRGCEDRSLCYGVVSDEIKIDDGWDD